MEKTVRTQRAVTHPIDNDSTVDKLELFKQDSATRIVASSIELGTLKRTFKHPISPGSCVRVNREFFSKNHELTADEIIEQLSAERQARQRKEREAKDGKRDAVLEGVKKPSIPLEDVCFQKMEIDIRRKGDGYSMQVSGVTNSYCSDGTHAAHKQFDCDPFVLKGDSRAVFADKLFGRMPPPNGVAIGLDALAQVMSSTRDGREIVIGLSGVSAQLDTAMAQLGFKQRGNGPVPKTSDAASSARSAEDPNALKQNQAMNGLAFEARAHGPAPSTGDAVANHQSVESPDTQKQKADDLGWLMELNKRHNNLMGLDARSGATQYVARPEAVASTDVPARPRAQKVQS